MKILIVKRSKFISFLIPCSSIDEFNRYLSDIKKEYKNANHFCYAYIIQDKIKCSDDKEPSKTAGIPILNCLSKNNLVNVGCIVARIFGGIKLGAAGLTRAYANSCLEAIKEAEITLYKVYSVVKIAFTYNLEAIVSDYVKNYNVLNKKYLDKVIYEIEVPIDEKEIFLKNIPIKFEIVI